MTHQSSITTLKFAAATLIAFGLAMFLALFTPIIVVFSFFLDLAIWPLDGAQMLPAAPEARLLAAVAGGMLSGWGAMIWLVTTHIYDENPALGGRIIVISVGLWFVTDSLGSIAAGAWFNAILNIGFLALFVLPIVLSRRPVSETSVTSAGSA